MESARLAHGDAPGESRGTKSQDQIAWFGCFLQGRRVYSHREQLQVHRRARAQDAGGDWIRDRVHLDRRKEMVWDPPGKSDITISTRRHGELWPDSLITSAHCDVRDNLQDR